MEISNKPVVKVESGHSRHLNIGNQARRVADTVGIDELFSRGKSDRGISHRLNERLQRISNKFVIVDNGDSWSV